MTLQVLVSTMHQTDHSLLEKMNIQSDAIVINQCDRNEIEYFSFNGHDILWMSLNERGIGLSRNTALMRASADIVLFADDDVRYVDGYPQMVLSAFEKNPKADFLLVDLESIGDVRRINKPFEFRRIRWYNSMHYGAVHFACKRESILAKSLSFSLLFGGGARYGSGEDSIFLAGALKSGMKVWSVPGYIGTVRCGASTWFKGYTDKYFFDKGILMGIIWGVKAYPLMIALLLKNRNQTKNYGLFNAIRKSFEGIRHRSGW